MVTCKVFTYSNVRTIQYSCANCNKPNIVSFGGYTIRQSVQKKCWFCFKIHEHDLYPMVVDQVERIRHHFSTTKPIISGIY